MPAEKFWYEGAVEGDEPDLTVSWGNTPSPGIYINGKESTDRAGLNRLIQSLRRARNQVYGEDA